MRPGRAAVALLALAWLGAASGQPAMTDDEVSTWRDRFARAVDRRLEVPDDARQRYLALLDTALAAAGLDDLPPQALLLVDRSAQVQAVMVLLRRSDRRWTWLGAAPVSTGRPGSYDHFRTPLGVFAHTLDKPDFRAEGSFNENGIRGYGVGGMRVFDFGWVPAERGWGAGGQSAMRLQMHATDPDRLEPRLGRPESKGCIRIPATLNDFLDRHGLLDADYLQAQARGEPLWILRADRQPLPWPGRYLVVVDSLTASRPAWAALPGSGRPAPRRPAASATGVAAAAATPAC